MADIGTAYLRVLPDTSALSSQMGAYFASSKWSSLGKAAGVALGAGLAAGGVVKGLYEIGQAFDDAYDKIRVTTGKSGKDLSKLEGSFKKVVAGVPADFDSAATAVAGLNQRLGLTGGPLQKLSKQMLELSRITDTDIGTNIQSVTRLFGDWSIKTGKQTETLNKLFRVSQATGIQVSELSDLMVQFGSPLRQLGLDFDTAAAMFARFEREGVNIQTLMPGLRFALKTLSGATPEVTAELKKLGVATNDPEKGLRQVFELIEDAGSAAEANQLAFKVFGVRAGPDMAAAIREGRFELDDLLKTMRHGEDTIRKAGLETMDFGEQLQWLKNNVFVTLEPVAAEVFGAMGDEMRKVRKILTDEDLSAEEKFSAVLGQIEDIVKRWGPRIAEAGGRLGIALIKGIGNAFLESDLLGKLFIGAAALKMFGGFGAFGALGGKIGGKIGAGIAAKLAAMGPALLGSLGLFGGVLGAGIYGLSIPEADLTETLEKIKKRFNDLKTDVVLDMRRVGAAAGQMGLGLRITKDDFKTAAQGASFFGRSLGEGIENMRVFRRAVRRLADDVGDSLGDVGRGLRIFGDDSERNYGRGSNAANRHRKHAADDLRDVGRDLDRTAQKTNDYQEDLSRSFARATTRSGKMAKGIGANVTSLVNGVGTGLDILKDNLNKSLAAFKVKKVGYSIKKVGNTVGDVVGAQQGAIVPGTGSGDKVPLHLDGRLAAMVEPGELVSVANRTATERLMAVNKAVPRRQDGGPVPRLAAGGGLDFALGPYDIPPIQYDPDHAGGNSHVHITGTTTPWVVAIGKRLQQMGWMVGEHPAFGGVQYQHSATGGHYDALAIDANTAADETRSEVAAVARLLGGEGGAVGAVAQKLAKLILQGPDGPPKRLGQAILDKAWNAASAFLAKQAPSGVAPTSIDTGGSVVAQMGRYLLANRFSRAGAAGIIGNAYRESLWDPGAVGTGGGGLFGFTTSPVSLADLQRYADKRGKPWTDVETQMAFMLGSPGGGGLMTDDYYNGLEGFLKSTNDIHDATYRFMNEWERPGIPAFEDRLAGAQKAYGMKSWQQGGIVQKLARGGIVEMIGKTVGAIRHMNDDRTKKATDRWSEMIKSVGLPEKLVEKMLGLRHDADKYGEYAGYASSLSDEGVLGKFLGATEAEWTTKQLAALFKLRNRLVTAKKLIDRRIKEQAKALKEAEKRLKLVNKSIKLGDRDRDDLEKRLEKAKKAKNKDLEKHLEDQLASLDERQDVRETVAKKLKTPIISSLKGLGQRLKGGDAEFSSKTLIEEALTSVQGIDGPMRKLKRLPAIGSLGGEIFEAQVTLKNLNAEANPVDTGIDISELRSVIEAARYGVFDGLDSFHTGGIVPGSGEVPIVAKGGEGVFTADQMAAMGKGTSKVEVTNNVSFEGMDLVIETMIDGKLAKRERREHLLARQYR